MEPVTILFRLRAILHGFSSGGTKFSRTLPQSSQMALSVVLTRLTFPSAMVIIYPTKPI